MNKELTRKLVKRFPVLYQDFYESPLNTCMCWGFDHGDGWNNIIWMLSLAIEEELGYSKFQQFMFLSKKWLSKRWNSFIYWLSPVGKQDWLGKLLPPTKFGASLGLKKLVWHPNTGMRVQQVKEKYGTLRYYAGGNERIHAFIRVAEIASGKTCQSCGNYGEMKSNYGWISVSCKKCWEEMGRKWEETPEKEEEKSTTS